MIKTYWCDGPHCGVLAVVDGEPVHPHGCSVKPIPIATLCSEPTVFDESDLAPGMVATLCHDFDGPHLVDPGESIWFWLEDVDIIGNHRLLEFVDKAAVRFVAGGRGRP